MKNLKVDMLMSCTMRFHLKLNKQGKETKEHIGRGAVKFMPQILGGACMNLWSMDYRYGPFYLLITNSYIKQFYREIYFIYKLNSLIVQIISI